MCHKHFEGLHRGNDSVWFSSKNDIRCNNLTTRGQVSNLVLSNGAWTEGFQSEQCHCTLVLRKFSF